MMAAQKKPAQKNTRARTAEIVHILDKTYPNVVCALHHKNVGLSKADRDRIGSELEGGKAAVGVLAPVSESSIVASKLTDLGGTTEAHDVPDEVLDEARTAAAAATS